VDPSPGSPGRMAVKMVWCVSAARSIALRQMLN